MEEDRAPLTLVVRCRACDGGHPPEGGCDRCGTRGAVMRPSYSWADVDRNLAELSGVFLEATFVAIAPCTACDGKGHAPDEAPCAVCGGLGLVARVCSSANELRACLGDLGAP